MSSTTSIRPRRSGGAVGRLGAMLALTLVVPIATAVAADEPGHAGAVDAAAASTVGAVGDSGIVGEIRKLLDTGQVDAAVAKATAYAAELPKTPTAAEGAREYEALNALCVALSRAGQLEQSEGICARAVELQPGGDMALDDRDVASDDPLAGPVRNEL